MGKMDEFIEKTKTTAAAMSEQTAEVFGKIKPGAEKLITDIKKKTSSVNKSKKSSKPAESSSMINTVIDGAYLGLPITEKKGVVYVGEKEISRMNCESYEVTFENEKAEEHKALVVERKKASKNPLNKMIVDKYLLIVWRNGEKSVICIDYIKHALIVKVLS